MVLTLLSMELYFGAIWVLIDIRKLSFLTGEGVHLFEGDQNFLGGQRGTSFFFSVPKGGDQNFLRIKEGGNQIFFSIF